jgi:hypothetical protein
LKLIGHYLDKFKNNFLKIILLYASLTAGVVACSKKTDYQTTQGGQDSGGGNTSNSSIEDVEFYYRRVIPQLPTILSRFFFEGTISKFKSEQKRQLLTAVINKINTDKEHYSDKNMIEQFITKFPINIKKNSSCNSIDKKHAHASIQKFEVGSPICISFSELTKNPKSSLEREIVSLLLHEYMHGLGYNEEDATTIQNALLVNFDRIFPNGIKAYVKKSNRELNAMFAREDFYGLEIKIFEEVLLTNTINEEHAKILCNPKMLRIYYERIIDEDTTTWSKLGPQLVDLGEISDTEIDRHLDLIDNTYDQIIEKVNDVSTLCTSTKKVHIPVKSRATIKSLISDLEMFYTAIEQTAHFVSQYN